MTAIVIDYVIVSFLSYQLQNGNPYFFVKKEEHEQTNRFIGGSNRRP